MQDDPSTPPPPSMPPPPEALEATEPPKPDSGKSTDNPIAVAGLVVSLLALVLSIIVIGGLIAFVGFSLSMIGLRRSKTLHRGRGAAIGGIALAVLALLFSIAATLVIIATLNGGDDVVINGISSRSTNSDFPPQEDLESIECSASEGGGLPLAIVEVANRSGGRSFYEITVEWDTASGASRTSTVSSDFIPDGDGATFRLFEQTGDGIPSTCRVTRIERSGFGLFNS